MAYSTSGFRPIFPVLDGDDNVNPYTGEVEQYSNWSIYNPVHLLDGAPYANHVPGTGRHPHDVHMSRIAQGYEDDEQPLREAGTGPRQTYDGRYSPLENKAAGNNLVFKASYGHEPGTAVFPSGQIYWYSNFVYGGLSVSKQFVDVGHAPRAIGAAGAAATFGRFLPDDPDPTRHNPMTEDGYGQTIPAGYDNEYGHNRVNEWIGVPSAEAL